MDRRGTRGGPGELGAAGDDAALVQAARGGDEAALNRLLERHYERVYALCRRITGDDDDALDATQDALIAIVRGLPRYDGRATFSTWAYRVTTNACLDELRRRKRRATPTELDESIEPPEPGAPSLDETTADRLSIDAALATLSSEFRAAVVLRDVLGLDYREIAEVLDVPAGTVRSRIVRRQASAGIRARAEPDQGEQRRRRQPMSDDTPLTDDEIDLEASLAIDGHPSDRSLTPADQRRVDARADELRPAVRALGASIAPPSTEVRARQIATAIGAATTSGTDGESGPGPGHEPIPLAGRSRRRRPTARSVLGSVAAVAAVVVAVIAINAAAHSGSNTKTAAQATSAGTLATGSAAGPVSGKTATTSNGVQNGTGKGARSLSGLGDAKDADALVALVRQARARYGSEASTDALVPSSQAALSAGTSTSAACNTAIRSGRPGLGALVFDARASLAGTPVEVLVYAVPGSTNGATRLIAADVTGCTVLVDRPL